MKALALALVFVAAACSAHVVKPVAPKSEVDYVRVAPDKLPIVPKEDDPLDGKRIVVTALLPPAGPVERLYAQRLFWEDLPIVKMTAGAHDPPAPTTEHQLVTVWGRYKKGRLESHGLWSSSIAPEIAVDRFEVDVRRATPAKSDGHLVVDEPEHVILDGVYGHGEERSAIDGTIWVSSCPTRPPDGPVRVDGWLFGKRGSYGHMNRYVMLLVANRCDPR